MAKIKNVWGDDRIVPALGNRLVLAGAVTDVPDDLVYNFTCQAGWDPVDRDAQKAHDAGAKAEYEALNPPADEAPAEAAPADAPQEG